MDPNDPCLACAIASGAVRPPGGVLLRTERLLVHGFAGPSPLRGWAVVTSARHARALYDLEPQELLELGPLVARVQRAQLRGLGADHSYAVALGDVLRHFHLHVVPKFEDTPGHLQGRRAFDARPEDLLPEAEAERALTDLASHLRSS